MWLDSDATIKLFSSFMSLLDLTVQTTKKIQFSADFQYYISVGYLCLIVLHIALSRAK
ncbi:hypothetical protein KL86DYS1_10318 [uncultured Dysgonomonas sp.]|uniref:Uncharacterized protein n=1 Tax=uncultured Dysgonomonas sp. TaxID=206096 RepID=A0A212IVV9_9BACT|nr:hypothetical protein KL86DYS1_10318 [uncultured Dysgonomonas sp.]